MKRKKYIAFVPARSGSKRIKNKNIKILGEKPLFMWTVDKLLNIDLVEKIIFSTDSDLYIDILNKNINDTERKKILIDKREKSQASDSIKIYDYIKDHLIHNFNFDDFDSLIISLPTSPFKTEDDFYNMIELHENKNRSVFSASTYSFPVSFSFNVSDEGWIPLLKGNPMLDGNTRSQDQKQAFHPNGAIYIMHLHDLKNKPTKTLYINAIPYILIGDSSIDIDTEYDFKIAEFIVQR